MTAESPDPDALTPLPEPAEGLPVVPCAECDEPLHDRVSRLYRLGPRCRRKLGIRIGPGLRGHEVPQDGLFG
jgi:hypothetical protein